MRKLKVFEKLGLHPRNKDNTEHHPAHYYMCIGGVPVPDIAYVVSVLTESTESAPEVSTHLFFTTKDVEQFMEEAVKKKTKEYRRMYRKNPTIERANGRATITVEHERGRFAGRREAASIEAKMFDLSDNLPVQIPFPEVTGGELV